jgi:endonuclease/exonuclease/phosphatase (EEP) superfamily protein YafD
MQTILLAAMDPIEPILQNEPQVPVVEPEQTKAPEPPKVRKKYPFQFFFLFLSFVWLVFLFAVYGLQPDFAVAATIWPAWAWAILGLLLTVALRRGNRWLARGAVLLWLGFGWVYSEDIQMRFRNKPRIAGPERVEGSNLRVATINSNVGNEQAAAEPLEFKPDVVFIQESPSEDVVQEIGQANGMAALHGVEASILVRGKIFEIKSERLDNIFTAGRAIIDGKKVLLVSLRLKPPIGRADLWNPAAWTAYTEDRKARREELETVRKFVDEHREGDPAIIGGDFNAVSSDSMYRVLDPMVDACESGCGGWPNTAINPLPFARIDQIWTTKILSAKAVTVVKTKHSDHRMVLADFDWQKQ